MILSQGGGSVCVVENVWFNLCSRANLILRQSSTKLLFWFSKPQVRYMCILYMSVGGSFFHLPPTQNVIHLLMCNSDIAFAIYAQYFSIRKADRQQRV